VKSVHLLPGLRRESHVHAGLRGAAAIADPEEGLAVPATESADPRDRLHEDRQPERGERLLVEGLAAVVVGDVEAEVIEHRYASVARACCLVTLWWDPLPGG